MTRVAVLGAGLVGRTIARDLARDAGTHVLACDRSAESLAQLGGAPVTIEQADLSDPREAGRIAGSVDLVVGAVPGRLGLGVLRAVLEAGRPIVDISFTPEDPVVLDGLARERGLCAVVDCGVAPGLSNLLAGRAVAELERTDAIAILVGGLPLRRSWPYEYRIVFSATDVIEEYTRPARVREHGVEVVHDALSGAEPVEIDPVGTLEAFYTDGLRSLLRTLDVPTLTEKTLRYPGHAERMRMLRETGFFDEEPLDLDGTSVVPRTLTERLLFDAWIREPDEEEFTVLRVEARGSRGGAPASLRWDLFDRTDASTGETSMARTTGFPAAIVARMILDGRFREPGVHPPEVLGRDAAVTAHVLEELERRGVRLRRQ